MEVRSKVVSESELVLTKDEARILKGIFSWHGIPQSPAHATGAWHDFIVELMAIMERLLDDK